MNKNWMILAVLLIGGFCFGETPLFPDDVSFHISFDDGSVEPELASGKEKLMIKFGSVNIQPGNSGQALLCGKNGAKLRFDRKDNLSFDNPGTLVFFYKPLDWEKSTPAPRLFFWGVESSKGYVGLQFANDPKNICACARPIQVLFLYGKNIPSSVFQINAPGKSGCENYHMIAISWRANQLKINYDQTPGKVFDLPFTISDAEFPDNSFSIGTDSDWNFMLDEFTVYNRQLSDEALLEIYNNFFKDAK